MNDYRELMNSMMAQYEMATNKAVRYEDCLINAIEHAIDVSTQYTHDLLRAMGITSEELEDIGYDRENFPKMHEWVNED